MSVPGKSLAKDLFEDMGRKVQEAASTMTEDGEPTKIVEEIESLCMNCHDDVSLPECTARKGKY